MVVTERDRLPESELARRFRQHVLADMDYLKSRGYNLPAARASARLYMNDQHGMRAIGAEVSALTLDPNPPDAFVRGDYRRLRIGAHRVMYVVEDDLITIELSGDKRSSSAPAA